MQHELIDVAVPTAGADPTANMGKFLNQAGFGFAESRKLIDNTTGNACK
jgi:hypothetical protein